MKEDRRPTRSSRAYPPHLVRWAIEMNREDYFEAHEFLEHLWHRTEDNRTRELYQGLVQVAVALHHLGHGNPVGAVKVYASAKRHLAGFSGRHRGVDLDALRAAMEKAIGPFEGIPFEELRHRRVDWGAIEKPRIELDPPPDEATRKAACALEVD